MYVIVYQFQTVKFIQMMSLTFGLFTQVSGSGPLGPLVQAFHGSDVCVCWGGGGEGARIGEIMFVQHFC